MSTIVEPGSGRLRAEAAELAKHYGVTVAVCPPRRAQRKGVVEAAIRYIERSWWRSAQAATPAVAQGSLDRWCVEVADERRSRGLTVAAQAAAEPLLPLPPVPYPAELRVERVASSSALVAFEGNRYSVPPGLAGQTVAVLARLGEITAGRPNTYRPTADRSRAVPNRPTSRSFSCQSRGADSIRGLTQRPARAMFQHLLR